jgi:hypothetical protein
MYGYGLPEAGADGSFTPALATRANVINIHSADIVIIFGGGPDAQ